MEPQESCQKDVQKLSTNQKFCASRNVAIHGIVTIILLIPSLLLNKYLLIIN